MHKRQLIECKWRKKLVPFRETNLTKQGRSRRRRSLETAESPSSSKTTGSLRISETSKIIKITGTLEITSKVHQSRSTGKKEKIGRARSRINLVRRGTRGTGTPNIGEIALTITININIETITGSLTTIGINTETTNIRTIRIGAERRTTATIEKGNMIRVRTDPEIAKGTTGNDFEPIITSFHIFYL